ncbi:lysin [Listeria monocytogenes]|nr:lysin [Listeria monocytogenes]
MYTVTIKNGNKSIVLHSQKSESKLLSAVVKKGINTIDSFSFTISKSNPGYNELFELKTLINVFDVKKNELVFEGRVLSAYEEMQDDGYFKKEIVCESELGFLNDSVQRHGEFHNISPAKFLSIILDTHNEQVETEKQIFLGSVTVTDSNDSIYKYLTYDKTFAIIQEKLIKILGGEIKIRKSNNKRYLDYLTEIGERKSTEIKLKKNLKSIKRTPDATEVVSRLVPLGTTLETQGATDASQKRLDIKNVNNGKDYLDDLKAIELFGIVEGIVIWNDVTKEANLLSKAKAELQNNNHIKMKTQITAYDLSLINRDFESFDLYNYYPVVNPIMNIDDFLRVVEKTIDLLNPQKSSLSLGDKLQKLTTYQADMNRQKKQVYELESVISTQNNRINTLNTNLSQTQAALESLEIALSESDVTKVKEAIDNLKIAVETYQSETNNEIDLLNTEVQSLKEQQNANAIAITGLQAEIALLKK